MKNNDVTDLKQGSQTTPKETYVSPQITFTEIEVEQALMGFCKSSGSGGMPAGCNGQCFHSGS